MNKKELNPKCQECPNFNATSSSCFKKELSPTLIKQISKSKNEPKWMLEFRLKSLELFQKTPMHNWGPDLSDLDFGKIIFYNAPKSKETNTWTKVPKKIKTTFDNLGILRAEKTLLSGVGAQYDSTAVYHKLKTEWKEKGIIFEDMDTAIKKYPKLIKEYFMTKCVKMDDHKFAMLHGAVWSGGSFIYIPKDVKIDIPMQAYFRLNKMQGGQFEHTIIIAEENSEIHYIEGCSSIQYESTSLHSGCVELFVGKGAKIKYSSIEHWSRNMYNLNTKRAIVEDDGVIEWLSGNMGSKTTMLYPTSVLVGNNSSSYSTGITYAGKGQNQDVGAKSIHIGCNTTSTIKSKSIIKDGGIASYRGLAKVVKSAKNTKISVECDTLMLDDISVSNTYPKIIADHNTAKISHEAKIGKLDEMQIFYMMSRGISESDAKQMIVSGFASPIINKLPLEYAVELNKLIDLEIKNSLG